MGLTFSLQCPKMAWGLSQAVTHTKENKILINQKQL